DAGVSGVHELPAAPPGGGAGRRVPETQRPLLVGVLLRRDLPLLDLLLRDLAAADRPRRHPREPPRRWWPRELQLDIGLTRRWLVRLPAQRRPLLLTGHGHGLLGRRAPDPGPVLPDLGGQLHRDHL